MDRIAVSVGGRSMLEQEIENILCKALDGDAQSRALDFFAFLSAGEMLLERGKGYWEDKLYWSAKYEDEYVCCVFINDSDDKSEAEGWTIWTDDSGVNWFSDYPLNERMKKIVWNHVDICADCGGCKNPGGSHKTIFGKDFDHVCITAMKFVNPDADTLECLKKLVEIRKSSILR